MTICIVLMCVAAAVIVFAMAGYPVLLVILDKILKPAKNKKTLDFEPTLSYMIVAHNEEAVILNKLENAITLDYPREKMQIIVTSDCSTDRTNEIVKQFIKEHMDYNIVLWETVDHKGKTNAQNEGKRIATGEILVMTDANAMMKTDALKELVSYFSSDDVAYVCGKLVYTNDADNDTSESEATYWNMDLRMRDIESRFQTITAGNGSIYACRTSAYIEIPLIRCHDGAMPYLYAMQGKRALFNPDAISYEKAGENNGDEFKRKVRMNRTILDVFVDGPRALNVFKYKWFSLFYFGHRTCRYLLWLMHLIFFICSVVAVVIEPSVLYSLLVLVQIAAFGVSYWSISHTVHNRYVRLISYYGMTVLAQLTAAYRQITGKAKPVWEKAESTR